MILLSVVYILWVLVTAGAARNAAMGAAAGKGAGRPAIVGGGVHPRYLFYRDIREEWRRVDGGGGRRVFGGRAAPLREMPRVVALLDRYLVSRCSGALLAPRWVLTAAHCSAPHVSYVKYNTRRPATREGELAPVTHLYRHPEYEVVVEDAGAGADVTRLKHDVGLVRTRRDMAARALPPAPPHAPALNFFPRDDDPKSAELLDEQLEVFGFGMTGGAAGLGSGLYAVRLRATRCESAEWVQCVCGVSTDEEARGVCAGDSGGPVVLRGRQVAITSMGPAECTRGIAQSPAASSVMTMVAPYARTLNATVYNTDRRMRMRRVPAAAPPSPSLAPAVAALLSLLSFQLRPNCNL